MPYITKDRREKWLDDQPMLPAFQAENAGELNYVFTEIAQDYLLRKGLKYQHINDIVGALEGAKLEMYRRVAGPYEDIKIAENGDVYSPALQIEWQGGN